jgi:all-trans-8'-apo-beta-carotenal 15,15'-oxygenase
VFLQNAVAFNPLPFVLGQKGAAQCLASKPGQAGAFWLIPRPGAGGSGPSSALAAPIQVPAPEGFVFHHLNAFEAPAPEGGGQELVVDSIVYADFPSIGPGTDFRQVDFDAIPEGQLMRCRIDLDLARTDPARVWMPATPGWRWPSASAATTPCRRSRSWISAAASGGCGARRRGAS